MHLFILFMKPSTAALQEIGGLMKEALGKTSFGELEHSALIQDHEEDCNLTVKDSEGYCGEYGYQIPMWPSYLTRDRGWAGSK